MSGFSAEWLELREPFDTAARSARLVTALPGAPRTIVDLGCGTGSNLRYTAPRLAGEQRWLLVDNDAALLAAAEQALLRWARQCGGRGKLDGEALVVTAPGFSCEVRRLRLDLAGALEALPLPHGALVTSSALLDLASAAWIDRLAERCAGAGAAISFALTYDGAMAFEPQEAADGEALRLFNTHQHTNKGFGPALGPDAADYAKQRFAAAGYALQSARSDWLAAPADHALQRALLGGWHGAALQIAPARRAQLDEWQRSREAHIAAGRSALRVGHIDLIGWPER